MTPEEEIEIALAPMWHAPFNRASSCSLEQPEWELQIEARKRSGPDWPYCSKCFPSHHFPP